MSSGAGSFPHRYLWAYGAAKAGIDMLCKYAAEELGQTGVRVNSVQPGIVDDELMAFITAGGPLLDDYLAEMPISRVGTVEDIAGAVRFLAGPESAWITGETLAVDGGHHLRRRRQLRAAVRRVSRGGRGRGSIGPMAKAYTDPGPITFRARIVGNPEVAELLAFVDFPHDLRELFGVGEPGPGAG